MVATDSSQPSTVNDYKYSSAKNELCYAGNPNSSACSSPPGSSYAYSYDAGGNLTAAKGTNQFFNTAGTLNADKLCWTSTSTGSSCGTTPTGGTSYTYNNDGDRTAMTPSSGSATAYTYNDFKQLTQYQLGATPATTYVYDGTGLRMSKTTSGTTTSFAWSDTGADPLLMQEKTGTNTTDYVYDPKGRPIAEIIPSGATYYYSYDQLGSVRALTDSSGTRQDTWTYDPYGNTTASTGSVQNNLLFDGQYKDSESGLYYLRARYYDPVTAQFMTVDPLVESTHQPYAYTAGNPLNADDPTGLACATHLVDGMCLQSTTITTQENENDCHCSVVSTTYAKNYGPPTKKQLGNLVGFKQPPPPPAPPPKPADVGAGVAQTPTFGGGRSLSGHEIPGTCAGAQPDSGCDPGYCYTHELQGNCGLNGADPIPWTIEGTAVGSASIGTGAALVYAASGTESAVGTAVLGTTGVGAIAAGVIIILGSIGAEDPNSVLLPRQSNRA